MSSFISTRAEFEQCLSHFFNETNSCPSESNLWTWETKTILRHAYLKRKSVIIPVSSRANLPVIEQDEDVTVTEDPDLTCTNSNLVETVEIEHHIAYSTSYQVPVLYFRAFYQDGVPLSLDEIYKQIVPDTYHDQVIITQTDHPVLSTPFWHIHPCDTRKLMNEIQFEYLDYIKTWLSFNGPIVKCQISTEMFITHRKEDNCATYV